MNDPFELEEHTCLPAWWALLQDLGGMPEWLVPVDVDVPEATASEEEFYEAIRLAVHPQWRTVAVVSSTKRQRQYRVKALGCTQLQVEKGTLLKESDTFDLPLWVIGLE